MQPTYDAVPGDTFHSTKSSKNFEMGISGTETVYESYQNIRKLLKWEKWNIEPKILVIPGIK